MNYEKYPPYVEQLAGEMAARSVALKPNLARVKDSEPLGRGFHIVMPVGGQDRLPLTVAGILSLGQEKKYFDIPFDLTLADWGLTDTGRRVLAEVCNGVDIPYRYVQVDPSVKSAAHSFNTGVEAEFARQRIHGSDDWSIVKFDDDSIVVPGALQLLQSSLEQGYHAVSPLLVRTQTIEQLFDISQREALRGQYDLRGKTPNVREIWSDKVVRNGQVDMGTIMYSWTQREERQINTENLLAVRRPVAAEFNQAGGIFTESKSTGEGVEFFTQSHEAGLKSGYFQSAVLDRPDTLVSSNIGYGVDDALGVLTLEANNMLKPGLTIITRASDGRAITISAPPTKTQEMRGIMVMPEEMTPALKRLENMGVTHTQLQDILHTSLEKYKDNSRLYEQVNEIPVDNLISKFNRAFSIAGPIERSVRQYLSHKDISSARAWTTFHTEEGYEIVFPFEQPAPKELFSSDQAALGGVLHSLGTLTASNFDPNFVMTFFG